MGLQHCFQLSSKISCAIGVVAAASVLHTHRHHLETSNGVLSRCNLSFSSSFDHSFNSRCVKSNVVCKARDAIDQGLLRGVSVEPDLNFNSVEKDYTPLNRADLFPVGTSKNWVVQMEKTMVGAVTKAQMADHCVSILTKVMGSEADAQMCIYNVFWQSNFGFCCELDEECARELAGLPGVISVKPDPDFNSVKKDYTTTIKIHMPSADLFPSRNSKHWLVRMEKPMVGVVTKAQMVDHYVNILTKVMGNVVDAQMCIYHVSWQSNFGFCCELDEECAGELAGVPGVLSVQLDESFESVNKNYEGDTIQNSAGSPDTSEGTTITIKTKKLFITGLSFYTSENTLRTAFEGFGEIVEVKIIMDKISKRSKGYAFIEYTTEEAASAALNEMNGKIINGWMIVVDVAKENPPKFSRERQRKAS